jgi:hypothetical protein
MKEYEGLEKSVSKVSAKKRTVGVPTGMPTARPQINFSGVRLTRGKLIAKMKHDVVDILPTTFPHDVVQFIYLLPEKTPLYILK